MKMIIAAMVMALSGCAGFEPLPKTPPISTPPPTVVVPQTTSIPTGRETAPPIGCVEGRVRGVQC